MRYRSSSTRGIGRGHGNKRAILRWWNSPAELGSGLKPRAWATLTLASLITVIVIVASTSLWNFYGLSLPVPRPTSDITALQAPQPMPSISRPSDRVEWEFYTGGPLTTPATTASGSIYIVSGNTPDTGAVASLAESEGSQLWRVKLNSVADYPPVVGDEMVYVGTRAGNLIALDRHTGETVWASGLGSSVVGAPIVREGTVFTASKAVYAIDAATGKQLWRHEVGGDISRPIQLSGQIISAISSDGNANIISAENGRRRLTFPLWFSTSAAPILAGKALVIPGDRAFVQALDINERDVPMEKAARFWWTKLWLWDLAPRPPLPRGYLWQNRTLDGDTAYALGADESSVFIAVAEVDGTGTIVSLDLATGETQWELATATPVLAPAILTKESIIAGMKQDGILVVAKSTGVILWELSSDEGLSAAPTLTDSGLLLVPTASGLLRAVR